MVRRLPWLGVSPWACTSVMRPTPEMIPVNIRLFSQGLGLCLDQGENTMDAAVETRIGIAVGFPPKLRLDMPETMSPKPYGSSR